jgi:hypothetical protein
MAAACEGAHALAVAQTFTGLRSDATGGTRQAEMVTAYLVDAYEKVAMYVNREFEEIKKTPELARMLESAVAKIQLLGTQKQVDILNSALDKWAETERKGQPGTFIQQCPMRNYRLSLRNCEPGNRTQPPPSIRHRPGHRACKAN